MSVILQIATFIVSQGWNGKHHIAITNSGDENIDDIFIKIIDSSVFDALELHGPDGQSSCLNTFTADTIYTYTTEDGAGVATTIPASSTRYIYFIVIDVKDAAPIQDNPLVCYFQYRVY